MTRRPTAESRFTGLVDLHGPSVLGYLARRTDPPQDAADLTAEVFVVAWRRLDDVPPDPSESRAWLLGVARRVLSNHHRGALRRNQLADRLRQHLHVQAQVAPDDRTAAVRAALERLDPEDREVLTLVAWEDLTSAQAAQVLGVSAPAVRKRLQRARARLRAHLGEEDPAPVPVRPL